jgi:hypothetical protein
MTFTPSARTARLTELATAGQVKQSEQLAGVALPPDGTKLALDLRRSIEMITLATGARREWTWPRGGWVGNFKPNGQVLSWTADGRKLAFQQWAASSATPPTCAYSTPRRRAAACWRRSSC